MTILGGRKGHLRGCQIGQADHWMKLRHVAIYFINYVSLIQIRTVCSVHDMQCSIQNRNIEKINTEHFLAVRYKMLFLFFLFLYNQNLPEKVCNNMFRKEFNLLIKYVCYGLYGGYSVSTTKDLEWLQAEVLLLIKRSRSESQIKHDIDNIVHLNHR